MLGNRVKLKVLLLKNASDPRLNYSYQRCDPQDVGKGSCEAELILVLHQLPVVHCRAPASAARASQIQMPPTNKVADPEDAETLRTSVCHRISLVPVRYTKTIHFVRHGQGFHNVAGAQFFKGWSGPKPTHFARFIRAKISTNPASVRRTRLCKISSRRSDQPRQLQALGLRRRAFDPVGLGAGGAARWVIVFNSPEAPS